MAAEISRMLDRPVNRKLVRRVYRRMGWGIRRGISIAPRPAGRQSRQPVPTKSGRRTTHYVWCGPVDGWYYCFNVLDIFTRQWIAYRFDTLATAGVAVESLVEAVAAAKPDCSKMTLQCDNGSQYASKKFRKAASILGIRLKFILTHTPEQNGHVEAFHGTLKREYIWPHDFANYQQAEAVIAEAFRDYNRSRLHSALKYVPPDVSLAS